MYGGCVGFGEIFMVDYVMCVSMFKYVVFMCIIQLVVDYGQGIFFWCGCGFQCLVVIFQWFYLQFAVVQQLLQVVFDVVIVVQVVVLFVVCQVGVN